MSAERLLCAACLVDRGRETPARVGDTARVVVDGTALLWCSACRSYEAFVVAPEDDDDPLDGARGIATGLVIGLGMWGGAILMLSWLLS